MRKSNRPVVVLMKPNVPSVIGLSASDGDSSSRRGRGGGEVVGSGAPVPATARESGLRFPLIPSAGTKSILSVVGPGVVDRWESGRQQEWQMASPFRVPTREQQQQDDELLAATLTERKGEGSGSSNKLLASSYSGGQQRRRRRLPVGRSQQQQLPAPVPLEAHLRAAQQQQRKNNYPRKPKQPVVVAPPPPQQQQQMVGLMIGESARCHERRLMAERRGVQQNSMEVGMFGNVARSGAVWSSRPKYV